MAITLLDQETQIRNTAPVAQYNDAIVPSEANFETSPANLEDDLNNMRSMLSRLLDVQAGNWWDDINTPSALETGTQRGVNDLNTGLHDVEKKRFLERVLVHVDVTVTAAQNFEILLLAELPTNTTIAVGSVSTLGTVAADESASFGAHSLATVAGITFTDPYNLCEIVDSVSHDPILSGGQRVWGLLQSENASDGFTATGTTPDRLQISFVRLNAGGTAYEAVPVGDIAGQTIHYFCRERRRFEDLTEGALVTGGEIDLPAGSVVTRQAGYTGQGTTPVDLVTNATLDLEGAGLVWAIRDDLEADLFKVTEGSAGGTSEVSIEADADTFRVDAITNDFDNGAAFDTGAAGTTINVGVTANQIDSGGALTVASGGAGILKLDSADALRFADANEDASWSLDGIALSDSSQEWIDFEAAFGEVSLLDAITQAKNTTGRRKVVGIVTVAAAADVDVSGPANDNNLDTDLGDLSAGTFATATGGGDYDVMLNGAMQVNGIDAAANKDVYPGTALANGQLKFEKKLKVGDVITVVDWVA